MAWGINGTANTLGSAGDDLDITDLTAYDFNMFMIHTLATGGSIKHNFTFDDNNNSDYARGRSYNGAAKSNDTSQTQIEYHGDESADRFEYIFGVNLDGEEKLNLHFDVTTGGSGAGNAPNRAEAASKVDTSTNSGQYTRIDCFNTGGSGDYDTDSNITCIGTD